MSRINRDIYTSIDVNGPYIRIDTQPTSTTLNHNGDAVFTLAASTYYMTGDEADIGDIDTLETDAVAPTDSSLDNLTPGIPHTAKNDGYISYQWYEIDANSTPIGNVTKLTDSTVYSGTTTPTLTVKNVQTPGTHLNQYYCVLDYIPNLTSGQYDTGNAVNDTVTSDIVTLNVRPYLIITNQPNTTTTGLNPEIGTVSTRAILTDTRTPWDDYRLEYQWLEVDKLNTTPSANERLIDGDYTVNLTTSKTTETVVDRTQFTEFTESVSAGLIKKVGIPTEAVEVSFTISGGAGGRGGDFSASDKGGNGGDGRVGEFKFSSTEINNIRNAGSPSEYIITSGSRGNDGRSGISALGGAGGHSYDTDTDVNNVTNDSLFGGRGGSSGPGGSSGSGGGGGAGAGIISLPENRWMSVAGGGGGGGGASQQSSGGDGIDAGSWKEFTTAIYDLSDPSSSPSASELQPATVVNYNPKAGVTAGKQDPIQYGFFIKSTSPISTVNTTTNYRIVVVWNNSVVFDATTRLIEDDDATFLSGAYYVISGSTRYYLSTHKGSQLGWCDDETNLDSVCIRGNGGYVNSFDVVRYTDYNYPYIAVYDGAEGATKISGDGGGGGASGGGAFIPSAGGTSGGNPVASTTVDVIFKVSGKNNTGDDYIKFIEKSWYGFGSEPADRGKEVTLTQSDSTQTVTLKSGVVYDVVSSFESGDRTSDSLRILQDFTPDANDSDVITGRSIGMNGSYTDDNIQTGNEDNFKDLIVSVSDGTFDVSAETVLLDDGEILGKSIIRYTAPTGFRNQTAATGGQGGESQYDTTRLDKLSNGSLNSGQGAVNMVIKTEQPFDDLIQTFDSSTIKRNLSIRGAHPYPPTDGEYKESGYTSDLRITSDYVFSKRLLCQISVKDTGESPVVPAETSFSNSIYTDIVDFIVLDDRDNTITVEHIRHNDDFAILTNLNLNNGDITFERSNLDLLTNEELGGNIKETEYYSFYSNRDIEVDIQMYGGKGNDVGSFLGGEGGWSYLRLNMEANTEYVIAGLDEYVNTPFLFKKGQLLATVGGGGDANTLGNGGRGGGVSVNGEAAFKGGAGGIAPTSALGENGVHGSASDLLPISPDTKASIPNGGTAIRCSKGNLFQFGNQPSPCEDRGSAIEFGLSDGTLVTNTKKINRGFKAGYNVLYTAGRNNGAIINQGWGGSGATGGQGNDSYGGGGGSGYIIPSDVDAIEKGTADIFVRSEGNSERVNRILEGRTVTTDSLIEPSKEGSGGNPISSTLGGSTGNAKVIMSLAEIPSNELAEFIERPVAPVLEVSQEDVAAEPEFIPLPEITPPSPITPPNPKLFYTKTVSRGFTANSSLYGSNASGNRIDMRPFSSSTYIPVLETGSIEIFVETEDIPSTRFYWKVVRLGSAADSSTNPYTDGDFESMTGSFTTTASTGNKCTGSFIVTPTEDNQTDFTGPVKHRFKVYVYSDPGANTYNLTDEEVVRFEILDNSLSAPVATLNLNKDKSSGSFRANNQVNEGVTLNIDVNTLNIHDGQTIGWEIVNVGTVNTDFSATSGTVNVTANYDLDADGNNVAIPKNASSPSNAGSATIQVEVLEDQLTEPNREAFALKIEYPSGSGTYITNTKTGVGDDKKSVEIIDTSQNPEADITANNEVDEGADITFSLSTENYRNGEAIHWKLFRGDSSSTTQASTNDFEIVKSTVSAHAATVSSSSTNSAGNRIGTASITLTTKADGTTEGDEQFTLKLYRDSNHSVPVYTTPGTNTHSIKTFTVKDTSLDPVEYKINKFSGLNSSNEANEDGGQITFTMEAWNLSSLASGSFGPQKWKIFFKDTDTAAIAGDYTTNDKADFSQLVKEHDFNTNNGDLSFTRLGYVSSVGSDVYKTSQDPANGYIIPYHTATGSFTPVADYMDDVEGDSNGDKEFEIGIFQSTGDREKNVTKDFNGLLNNNRSNVSFKIKNNVKPLYKFNKSTGFGSENYNSSTSSTTPKLDEGKTYSFRIETTAPPQTDLWYAINKKTTTPSEDFDLLSISDLPNDVGYPISSNYITLNKSSGRIETFALDVYADKISGVEKVRSIGFIYFKISADKITEGEEEFEIIVYNEGQGKGEVLRQLVKINDTSRLIGPNIVLTMSGVSGTKPNYEITVGPDSGKTITLNWTVPGAGDAATSGTRSLPSGIYNSGASLSVSETFYTSGGSATGTLKPVARGTSDNKVSFSLSASNAGGTSIDTVNLTIKSEAIVAVDVTYEKYQAVPLYRYKRKGAGGNTRYGHSVFGPGVPGTADPSMSSSNKDGWGTQFQDRFGIPPNSDADWRLQGSPCPVFTSAAPGTVSMNDDSVTFKKLDSPHFASKGAGGYGFAQYFYFNYYSTNGGASSGKGSWTSEATDFDGKGGGDSYCYVGRSTGLPAIDQYNISDAIFSSFPTTGELSGGGGNPDWTLARRDVYGDASLTGFLGMILAPKLGFHYWRVNSNGTKSYYGQTAPTSTATETVIIVDKT